MPAIVEFPQVVRDAVPDFADLFACQPQRRHFAEYLTGLMVARKKIVSAINREFAETTDPSCLNKFLNDVPWDEQALNERRLKLLQGDEDTRYHEGGVIVIDGEGNCASGYTTRKMIHGWIELGGEAMVRF